MTMKIVHVFSLVTLSLLVAPLLRADFSPGELSGLTLWLKADAGTYTTNGIPTTSGQYLGQWADQSPSGYILTRTNNVTDNERYRYLENGIGGRPYISCGSAGRGIDLPTPIMVQTVFFVGTPPPTDNKNPLMILGGKLGTSLIDIFVRHGSADAVSLDGTASPAPVGHCALNGSLYPNVGASFSMPNNTIPNPYILYVQYTNSYTFNRTFRRDSSSDPYHYIGTISELIVYNRTLTAGEVQSVGYYLQTKYGVPGDYVNPASYYIRLLSIDRISDTAANVAAEIGSIPPGQQAELRLYYGPTDGGTDPDSWLYHDVIDTGITTNSTYIHTTQQPLAVNTTHYCRFAAFVDGVPTFSEYSPSFVTRPVETPAPFQYFGAYYTNDWNEIAWINLLKLYRPVPGGLLGDEAHITPPNKLHNIEISLTNSITLKQLTVGHGGGGSLDYQTGGRLVLVNGGDTPQTVTLDSGNPSLPVNLIVGGTERFLIGTNIADALTLRLNSPLNLSRHTDSNQGYIGIAAQITGGTFENPSHIVCTNYAGSGSSFHIQFLNPANTFIGDITLQRANRANIGESTCTLFMGRYTSGENQTFAQDGMLGHPTNRLILRNNTRVILNGVANDTRIFNLERTILGHGLIDRVYQDTSFSNKQALQLHLGDACRLMPGEGNNLYGMLRIVATNLTASPNSLISLKTNTQTNDMLYLDCRGPVSITSRLELQEQVRIPQGHQALIMTAPNLVSSLDLRFSQITAGYRIQKIQDPDGSWRVLAIRQDGTQLLLY